MLRIVRSLGLGINASWHRATAGVVVPEHVRQEVVQHETMINLLEEGQILLKEDDDNMDSK